MHINPHKTVSANSRGIIISFRDQNKHKFFPYENTQLEQIQMQGTAKYQQPLEQPVLNKLQQKLYGEAVYGLSYFSTEDVRQMSKAKKLRVLARYAKAQRILTRWKQSIIHEKVDRFFLELFPNSRITKALVETQGYLSNPEEVHSFKELGLTQRDVASKLIEVNILPKNFYQLT